MVWYCDVTRSEKFKTPRSTQMRQSQFVQPSKLLRLSLSNILFWSSWKLSCQFYLPSARILRIISSWLNSNPYQYTEQSKLFITSNLGWMFGIFFNSLSYFLFKLVLTTSIAIKKKGLFISNQRLTDWYSINKAYN